MVSCLGTDELILMTSPSYTAISNNVIQFQWIPKYLWKLSILEESFF